MKNMQFVFSGIEDGLLRAVKTLHMAGVTKGELAVLAISNLLLVAAKVAQVNGVGCEQFEGMAGRAFSSVDEITVDVGPDPKNLNN